MTISLHLEFDPPVTRPVPRADSLLLEALPMLEDIAAEWGVRPLSQFMDQGGRPAGQPRSDWHRLEHGIATLQTLAHHPACEGTGLDSELVLWLKQLEFAAGQQVSGFRISADLAADTAD
ncbi:hypothetical protein [Chitinilyticum piscinae]|uniref:Uncharacterized protein n=1 Tax=Chitinilyticum piscinae TaxID=2866724 RepID=A0A8J7KCU1_9NEIS|nr:hypothetical protein [Chitinilyticum piscinae]MBE9608094.1 hypothetical protein [Chitinilyticum piscinae]